MFATYSIAELTEYIRRLLEMDEALQDVWVSGEVSNMRQYPSGHWYFTLKDSTTQLKCVMWRSHAERQNFVPRDGDAVNAHGYVGVYDQQGVYQLYADRIRPVGVGDLYAQFERLKGTLQAEGLFDEERKRPIPVFPRKIGVVTSSEAAALRDVLNILRRRFPLAEVVLSSCLVQGPDSPPQIVAALQRLEDYADVDVIILCRGGGSIEDLWAFNDERVARAVVASGVPVITGVGHETDFTIVDFASDLRAPTPSAAAELATPLIDDLRYTVERRFAELTAIVNDQVNGARFSLQNAQRTLSYVSPAARVRQYRQRVDEYSTRLERLQRQSLALRRERLQARIAALNAASPQAILERGYAIVTRGDGGVVSSVADAAPDTNIKIRLRDGSLSARVEEENTDE